MVKLSLLVISIILNVSVFAQDFEAGFQDELSAPPVEDFLPSGITTTTTETPTAPPLPSPVDAVPAGNLEREEELKNFQQNLPVRQSLPANVHNRQSLPDDEEFHNVEDVDSSHKVENVRNVQKVERFENLPAVESPVQAEAVGQFKAEKEAVEALEEVEVAEEVEALEEVEDSEAVENVENVQSVKAVEAVEADEAVEAVEAVEEEVKPVEEEKPVEKVNRVKQPQKFNRLRTKISDSKKPDLPVESVKPEVLKPESGSCDESIHDCDGCAIPKHARNCRVKYFKDQARIKACADSGLIAKNILDQCPAKIEQAQEVVQDD